MTQSPDFLGRGWSFPIASEWSGVTLSAGDTNIHQSILLILETALGERVMRPDFGCELQKLVFQPNNDATAGLAAHYVKKALDRWEPRIEVGQIKTDIDPKAPMVLMINIDYTVRETNVPGNLVYPFYLPK